MTGPPAHACIIAWSGVGVAGWKCLFSVELGASPRRAVGAFGPAEMLYVIDYPYTEDTAPAKRLTNTAIFL